MSYFTSNLSSKSPSLAQSLIIDSPARSITGPQSFRSHITTVEETIEKTTKIERFSTNSYKTPVKTATNNNIVDSMSVSMVIGGPSDSKGINIYASEKKGPTPFVSEKKISIMSDRPSERKDNRPSHLRSKSSGVFTVKLNEIDPNQDPLNKSFDASTKAEVRILY
jgi:hypothetical protein